VVHRLLAGCHTGQEWPKLSVELFSDMRSKLVAVIVWALVAFWFAFGMWYYVFGGALLGAH
jgi:hypothetical protein